MPETSQINPVAFNCEGGLVLNKSTFLMQPGEALELQNFEPDIGGGYRRINGFKKYINHIVPQTSSSSESILMNTVFADKVIAARGEKIWSAASTTMTIAITADTSMSGSGTINVFSTSGFTSSGTLQINSEIFTYTGITSSTFTGVTRATSSTTAAAHAVKDIVSESWTVRDTGRTNAAKYSFEKFNFDGNDKIIVVDQTNAPTVFNTSFSATDVSESSVAGAKHVTAFKGHMFYSGMSSTPEEIVFSQPFDEDAFSSGSGAGSIKVDDTIVGMKTFREDLFIFCENRIFKLSGTSSSNFAMSPVTRNIGCINGNTIQELFAMSPVTRNIGCINGNTIQELAGDLIFLGPDGLRTVAGTAKIGDVELGTISKNVQPLFDEQIDDAAVFESVVIPEKTQYRLFFAKEGQAPSLTKGVICVRKSEGYEFSEIRGLKPSSTDTTIDTGDVLILHGDYTGYVNRQEVGNDFDGTVIFGKYRSPDLGFNDLGIRITT